jgi:DNA replication protein DnaC
MTTMSFSDLWKAFRLLSDPDTLSPELRPLLHDFLASEYQKRQAKRIQHLMNQSGIKRIKLLSDFDWAFNPKIPRDKLLDYLNTRFLKSPSNLVLIGPAGIGKSHLATAFCHHALSKGVQTLFISLFDLAARIDRSQHPSSLIDHYARVPVLCLDEIGYALPPPANKPMPSSRSSPNAPRSPPPSSPPTSSPPSGERSSTPPPPRPSSTDSV